MIYCQPAICSRIIPCLDHLDSSERVIVSSPLSLSLSLSLSLALLRLDSLRSELEQSVDAFVRARKELEEILVRGFFLWS